MSIKIAIDAGHGSNTAGKRTCKFTKDVTLSNGTVIKKGTQYREHYANVMVANFLYEELKRCGFHLIKTGWDDTDATDDVDTALSARQKAIKAAGCDYSVSCHFNASGNGVTFNSGQGVATYYHKTNFKNSKALATKVQAQLAKGTEQKNRGIKQGAFAMVNCKTMGTKASILCEYAFMTNEHEAQDLMANVEFCKECAVETAKGICEYCDVKYIKDGTNPYTVPTRELTKGCQGDDVKWLQYELNQDGATLDVDGDFGTKTYAAVVAYQKEHEELKIKRLGTVGKKTIKSLQA